MLGKLSHMFAVSMEAAAMGSCTYREEYTNVILVIWFSMVMRIVEFYMQKHISERSSLSWRGGSCLALSLPQGHVECFKSGMACRDTNLT